MYSSGVIVDNAAVNHSVSLVDIAKPVLRVVLAKNYFKGLVFTSVPISALFLVVEKLVNVIWFGMLLQCSEYMGEGSVTYVSDAHTGDYDLLNVPRNVNLF